jgi:hypothetical protein
MRHPWRDHEPALRHILLSLVIGTTLHLTLETKGLAATVDYPIVFVSRQIPAKGTDFYSQAKGMPGVGPFSRFQPAAPGKLQVRETSGQLRTLIDGANPTVASMNLIDVNAPDVSYDGSKIVFAGLPLGNYSTGPRAELGAWRIYVVNVDGSGLRQVTRTDLNLDYSQFGSTASYRFKNSGYDDTDPVWLPDGRICFSSTRWPAVGEYSAVAASNLYIINADGTNPHRITAERNGADRPLVDPLTGKIVYSRWWRNHRFPIYDMGTITDPSGGYIQKDGLTADRDKQLSGDYHLADFANRNSWHSASINPDGTGLKMFAGIETVNCNKLCRDDANQAYGGGFAPNGDFYANFFPMHNMSEAAGFGGIRRYRRGANLYTPIIGITRRTDNPEDYVDPTGPSFGVLKGNYAGETEVLPDGRLLISWAVDIKQDYGLYVINADGSNRTLVHDSAGTTELRARLIKPRSLPPIIPDVITQVASPLPPLASGPYDKDGTFVYAALNVYANAPVDWDISSAIPVGTAAKIRFFIDHQRLSWGSLPNLDWPILLSERTVAPDGSVTENAPANVPLFEQIRSNISTNAVPLTGPPYGVPWGQPGAAHVAGMNFDRPGSTARCMGCHTGHSMIPVPANDADAQWTNLAPGASVAVSSGTGNLLIDRKAAKASPWSASSATGQWAKLTFPVPINVRSVRLWNPRNGTTVNSARVRLFSDSAATQQVGDTTSGALSINGTDVAFNGVVARAVRVDITSVTGSVAALAEIEVIASGNTGATPPPDPDGTPPAISGVSASQITTNSATITWATDEKADSQVEYGLTSTLGTFSTLNATQTTAHQIGLSGLEPGKTYYFRVISRDGSGNLASSGPLTFVTTADAPPPPSNLTILSLSPTRGRIGTIVTITGTGFGNTQGTTGRVTFSGIVASISLWSDTSIKTVVPSGAVTGPVLVTKNGIQSNALTFKVNRK